MNSWYFSRNFLIICSTVPELTVIASPKSVNMGVFAKSYWVIAAASNFYDINSLLNVLSILITWRVGRIRIWKRDGRSKFFNSSHPPSCPALASLVAWDNWASCSPMVVEHGDRKEVNYLLRGDLSLAISFNSQLSLVVPTESINLAWIPPHYCVVVSASRLGNELPSQTVNKNWSVPTPDVIVTQLSVVVKAAREHLPVQSDKDTMMKTTCCLNNLPCR